MGQTLSVPWEQYRTTGDIQVLRNACGSGQTIPDTELAVLYYSLVYQQQHYDAVAKARLLPLVPVTLPMVAAA